VARARPGRRPERACGVPPTHEIPPDQKYGSAPPRLAARAPLAIATRLTNQGSAPLHPQVALGYRTESGSALAVPPTSTPNYLCNSSVPFLKEGGTYSHGHGRISVTRPTGNSPRINATAEKLRSREVAQVMEAEP
jgi:hypothetical protein